MKLSLAGGAALAVLGAASLLAAQPPDVNQPQSPPRGTTPQWVKMTGQGQNDPRLKGYSTPEGLKLEIVAEAPTVVNPVGMAFADDGTLYVLEWLPDDGPPLKAVETVHYKDGSMRAFPVRKKRVKDRVKRLRDSKGNGTYDQAEVILEDELPSAVLAYDGWLYVAGRGTVRRYKPSKPGGPYDVREVIARGFCADGTTQVSGLPLGNDGSLYITSGSGDNVVEGSDGSRATVLGTGGVFRCRPDGSHMEVYSAGFVNPRGGVAFDAGCNAFLADDGGGADKFDSHRLLHVPEGGNFNGRVQAGGGYPRHPPVLETRRGPAAALLCYNDTRLPESYRGLLYYPNPEGIVRAFHVEPDGAAFAVTEEFNFLTSDRPGFHPCQALTGPDGAVYLCDTGAYLGADRLSGDGEHGRIYRISWAGTKEQPALPLRGLDSWAKIDKMSEQDLLDTLAGPDFSDRCRAGRALVRKGEAVRPALLKLLGDGGQPLPARIAALGAVQSFWNDDVRTAFVRLLDDGDPDLRRPAADGLGLNCKAGDETAHHALLQVLGDPNSAVRRAVFLAMGRIGGPGAADDLVNALAFDEGKDVYLRDGLVRAIERMGKTGTDRLLALAQSGDEKNLAKVVEAFEALRTRPGADAVSALLKYPHLSVAQRAGLVRSYGNYLLDPPVDLGPLVDYLAADRDEALPVKLAGVEVVALDRTARGAKAEAWLLSLLDDPHPTLPLAVIEAVASTRLEKGVPPLLQVLRDPARPVEERVAVARALRAFGKDRAAVAALKDVLQGAPAELRDEARRTLAVIDPSQGKPEK